MFYVTVHSVPKKKKVYFFSQRFTAAHTVEESHKEHLWLFHVWTVYHACNAYTTKEWNTGRHRPSYYIIMYSKIKKKAFLYSVLYFVTFVVGFYLEYQYKDNIYVSPRRNCALKFKCAKFSHHLITHQIVTISSYTFATLTIFSFFFFFFLFVLEIFIMIKLFKNYFLILLF